MKILMIASMTIICLVVLLGLIGFLIPEVKSAEGEFVYNHEQEIVWKKMRDLTGQKEWRKELDFVEILDESLGKEIWIEKMKTGTIVKLKTTQLIDLKEWGMETFDSPMIVSWKGSLEKIENSKTRVRFRYESKISNPYFRLIATVFLNLGDMIEKYSLELDKALQKDLLKG